MLATGGNNWLVRLWDATSEEEVAVLDDHLGGVRSVRFSPDSRQLVSASEDQTVRVWDLDTVCEYLTERV